MNYVRTHNKKKWLSALTLFLFVMVLGLGGCGSEEVLPTPAPTEPPDSEPVSVERTWEERIDVPHPERDPFGVKTVEARTPQRIEIIPAGRDPFAPDAADVEERQRTEIAATGRDPFAEVDDEVDVTQPDPPDDPGLPDDNGEDPSAEGMLAITVVTLDRCWLDVFVDGERVIRTNVPVGETLSWEGQNILLDQVGRDYALSLTLNGRNLGVLSQQLAPALEQGPVIYEFDDVRVRVTLNRRMGGVLLGLRFQVID